MANKAWGKDSEEYQKWMKGSEEYTKFLPEDAAYFTGINPNTGESADEYGNELLGINRSGGGLGSSVRAKTEHPKQQVFASEYLGVKTLPHTMHIFT